MKPRLATLARRVRNTALAFTFTLDGDAVGPSPKVIAVLRRSSVGEYRLGVRVGDTGKIRLSISKARTGKAPKGLGRSVVIRNWRYRAGDRIRVLAQAIKRDPTQLRMKVWRVGSTPPGRWQIVRTDGHLDIGARGRVGLMSLPTGKPRATTGIRYDEVVVRSILKAKRVVPRPPTPKSDDNEAPPAPVPPKGGATVRMVPATIDASGGSNVTSQLQKVIDGAPNGSTIRFRAGARYKLGTSLIINGRRNLTLDGNGAQLDIPRTDMGKIRSVGIQVRGGATGTTIRDLTLVGSNAQAGTSQAFEGRESNHGIAVLNASDTLIEDVEIRRTGSDCLYISRSASGGASQGVTFRDSTCRLSGRHGVGLIAGHDVRIVDNVFDDIGFDVIDIEPNTQSEGATGVLVRGNTIGAYALDADWDGWLVAACGPKNLGAVIRDVTVTGNTVEGNRAGWSGQTKALHIKVCGDRGPRRDFVIKQNVALSTVAGPAMTFTEVDGVTVTGNKQPLSGGSLATFPGSTGVTHDG